MRLVICFKKNKVFVSDVHELPTGEGWTCDITVGKGILFCFNACKNIFRMDLGGNQPIEFCRPVEANRSAGSAEDAGAGMDVDTLLVPLRGRRAMEKKNATGDIIVDALIRMGKPLTVENWVSLNYGDSNRESLEGEELAELQRLIEHGLLVDTDSSRVH
jgi:hypothetical protein